MSYAAAFALTVAVELALVALLARRERVAALAACLCVNALTHPIAGHLVARGGVVEALELGVVTVEALGYRALLGGSWRRAWALAGLANAVTWSASYWL